MPSSPSKPVALSELDREVIALFVRIAALLNMPRSVGEIYGLLYLSETPLCLGDCMQRLQLSKGAVSQGLRILRSFGSIRPVYIPGERRDFYQAETELRRMTAGFIAEQLAPQLQDARHRLDRIDVLANGNGSRGQKVRIGRLRNWERRAERLIPLLQRVVGPVPSRSTAQPPATSCPS